MSKNIPRVILGIGIGFSLIGLLGLATGEGLDGLFYIPLTALGVLIAVVSGFFTIITTYKNKKRIKILLLYVLFLLGIPISYKIYTQVTEDNGLYYPAFCDNIEPGKSEESIKYYNATCSKKSIEGYKPIQ